MSEMFLTLKPGPFVVRDKGDPKQLFKEFVRYKEFLVVTKSGMWRGMWRSRAWPARAAPSLRPA